MLRHILRDQLDVCEDEFWDCVLHGRLPDRGATPVPKEALPADLVYLLVHRVGLAAETVAELTKEEAVTRLQRCWNGGIWRRVLHSLGPMLPLSLLR